MIETAIVLPVYMLVLLGLIYFGFATLTRQRQARATAYAAWMPGTQQADQMLNSFWSRTDAAMTPTNLQGSTDATAGDTELNIHGGGLGGAAEWTRQGDEYYNLPINGTIFIPAQMAAGIHALGDGGTGVFDRERIEVSLWNFALGATRQSFNWVPGQGAVQQFNTSYTSFARYLNKASPQNNVQGQPRSGLMRADDGDAPRLGLNDLQGRYGWLAASALNGNGVSADASWMERRSVETNATYLPPFFGKIYSEPGATPNTTSADYFNSNYPTTSFKPTATTQFDVTGRTDVMRLSVEEAGGQPPNAFLGAAAGFFGMTSPADPARMDNTLLVNAAGAQKTMKQAWNPW